MRWRTALASAAVMSVLAAGIGVRIVGASERTARGSRAARLSAAPGAHPSSAIAIENRRHGDAGWRIAPDGRRGVKGFVAPVAAPPGADFTLYIRTRAATLHADVYRLGWYGGAGGRLVVSLGPVHGDRQSPCPADGPRFTVACHWRETLTLRTGPNWTSGIYVAKLEDSAGSASYVPFVVRERISRARTVLVIPMTTWQAYNRWGGRSLYRGPGRATCACSTRSRAVTFDRPYSWPGAGNLFSGELQVVQLLESHGVDVGYATSLDLHGG